MIRTSHVGSFPLDYSCENVEKVILDLHRLGIDVPPYPQLSNFIESYLKPLEDQGYLYSRKGVFFIRIAMVDDWRGARLRIPEAEDTITIVKRLKLNLNWLRAPVTGPFTLASRVYISEDVSKGLSATCLARKDLVLNTFSNFVAHIVNYMINLGYNLIFIDEPVFNYIIGSRRILFDYKADEIVEVMDKMAKRSAGVEFGIHVCGNLNPKILELVMQMPNIKYISIELHDTPSNINLVSKELLEKYDKYLAPGIVSAQKPIVESVDDALIILKYAYEKAGGRLDLVSGDCGFRGLMGTIGDREKEYWIAISKLRVVVEAVKRLVADSGVARGRI